MKLVHIKQIKGSRSLYGTFLYMTLLPLFIFGIVLMIYSSYTQTQNIRSEVSDNLRNVGIAVLSAYDAGYEGDYGRELEAHYHLHERKWCPELEEFGECQTLFHISSYYSCMLKLSIKKLLYVALFATPQVLYYLKRSRYVRSNFRRHRRISLRV